jgi:hypothetical protein
MGEKEYLSLSFHTYPEHQAEGIPNHLFRGGLMD